jgi:hypothetical protein
MLPGGHGQRSKSSELPRPTGEHMPFNNPTKPPIPAKLAPIYKPPKAKPTKRHKKKKNTG